MRVVGSRCCIAEIGTALEINYNKQLNFLKRSILRNLKSSKKTWKEKQPSNHDDHVFVVSIS